MSSKTSIEKGFARVFVVVANVLFLIMGIILIAFGIEVSKIVTEDFDEINAKVFIFATVVLGILILILSFVGFCAVFTDNTVVLFTYSAGVFTLTIGLFTLGGLLLSFINDVKNAKDGKPTSSRQSLFLDFTFASFEQCCNQFVPTCGVLFTSFCTTDPDKVDAFAVGMLTSGFCDFLEGIEINGHPLVSTQLADIAAGSCGGGSTVTYLDEFSTVVEENLNKLAVIDIISGAISALLLIASCYLSLEDDEDTKALEQNEGANIYVPYPVATEVRPH